MTLGEIRVDRLVPPAVQRVGYPPTPPTPPHPIAPATNVTPGLSDEEPTFTAGIPKVLFTGSYFTYRNRNYDISPDGRRFLMLRLPEHDVTQLRVVFNWFEELKAKMREAEQ